MMTKEKPVKKDKKQIIDRVVELVRLGHNNSQIGRALGIHRTTVKRYREHGEKRAIGTEARVRVVQDALSKHFSDLGRVCEQLWSAVRIDQPGKIIVEDLGASGVLTKVSSGRRGDEVRLVLRIGDSKVKLDHLQLEEDLLFSSLRRHTRDLHFWSLFRDWKDVCGEYLTNLSGFYATLKRRATRETGFKFVDSGTGHGLTADFARSIFSDVCAHTFFSSTGFEGVGYAIHPFGADKHEVRFDGLTIASGDKKRLEKCEEVHSQMLDDFRKPSGIARSLKQAGKMRNKIEELESAIGLELQKLILRRTFGGRCELCPD